MGMKRDAGVCDGLWCETPPHNKTTTPTDVVVLLNDYRFPSNAYSPSSLGWHMELIEQPQQPLEQPPFFLSLMIADIAKSSRSSTMPHTMTFTIFVASVEITSISMPSLLLLIFVKTVSCSGLV